MLIVHRAERADRLIGPLTEVLLAAPGDPLAPEVIAVPSRGVERWVSQQLALSLGATGARDGVAANIEFPSSAKLVGEVLARAVDLTAEEDLWVGLRLVWGLLEVIDSSVAEPWSAVLDHHLGLDAAAPELRAGRHYATAALLARLFASYDDNRPAMLTDWAQSCDTDGAGDDLPSDLGWQPELWRRLRERLGVPSPAERLEQACARLRGEPASARLPQRLSLFGPTRLSRTHLAVLDALAAQRELHLWLTHPSPAMWDTLAQTPAATRRRTDSSALQVSNPLLANLSRDVRELQQLLPAPFTDEHHGGQAAAGTVLARIQDDIAHDRVPGADGRLSNDNTVAIHACHGPSRQVEVLREELLHLLAQDDTLQPRDIIVLCPQVEIFAPLLTAAFAPMEADHPGHRIRVRLADRGLAQVNPLLDTVATLVALADGRVTASEVLDLAATTPVARRFGFTSSDQEVLRQWTVESGARWGLSHRERQRFGLPHVTQNTFTRARDRLLLGVTADESEVTWLGDALPLDGIDSGDVDLAGRFAEYLDRLDAALARLSGPQSPQGWRQALHEALDDLTAGADADAWQRPHAARRVTEALTGARWDLVVVEEAHGATKTRADLLVRLAANERVRSLVLLSVLPLKDHRLANCFRVVRWTRMNDRPPRVQMVISYERTAGEQQLYFLLRDFLNANTSNSFARDVLERAWRSSITALEEVLLRARSRLDVKDIGLERAVQAPLTNPRVFSEQATLERRGRETLEWWRDKTAAAEGLDELLRNIPSLGIDSKLEAVVTAIKHRRAEGASVPCVVTAMRTSASYIAQALESRQQACKLVDGQTPFDLSQNLDAAGAAVVATDPGLHGVALATDTILNYDLPRSRLRMEQRWGRIDRVDREQQVRMLALRDVSAVDAVEDELLRIHGFISPPATEDAREPITNHEG